MQTARAKLGSRSDALVEDTQERLTIPPAVVEQLTLQTFEVVRQSFTMLSEKRFQVIDITKEVQDRVLGADIDAGSCS